MVEKIDPSIVKMLSLCGDAQLTHICFHVGINLVAKFISIALRTQFMCIPK